jgi:predicted GNAT family N-acyltransferase
MLLIHSIQFGTPEYDEAVRLRYEVLRRPLGLEFSTDELAAEYAHIHLAAYDARTQLLGYLCLVPLAEGHLKMRQVAVAPTAQRLGVGTRLVEYAEQWATDHAYRLMVLHARDLAVPFYLRLGYEVYGESFEEVGIPHRAMRKSLGA